MHRHRGFTLLDVLITVVILGAAFLAVALLQGESIKDSQTALQRNQAMVAAQRLIDRFRDFAESSELEALQSGQDQLRIGGVPYTRSWTVQTQANGSRLLRLTVTWPDPRDPDGGASELTTLRLDTVISSYLPATEAATLVPPPGTPVVLTTTTTTACSGGGGMMGGGGGGGCSCGCGGMM